MSDLEELKKGKLPRGQFWTLICHPIKQNMLEGNKTSQLLMQVRTIIFCPLLGEKYTFYFLLTSISKILINKHVFNFHEPTDDFFFQAIKYSVLDVSVNINFLKNCVDHSMSMWILFNIY